MIKYISLIVIVMVLGFAGLTQAQLVTTDDANIDSVKGLVNRLIPEHAEDFAFEVICNEAGSDVFEIETRNDKVVIRGNNGVAMAMGLNWYLKYYCHCHISWCGNQLNIPKTLPAIETKIRKTSWAKHRYFLNYCCFGYSLPWWNWDQWERLIDWMALNGINNPLAVTGQEAVWQSVCKKLGMNDKQITEFLAGPPYLPFQWMGCLDGHGGPLPQSWIDKHEKLGKKILARERAFGMKPILQGFTGHVPSAIKQIYPDAKLHEIQWLEWTTYLLDPLDPRFSEVSKLYLNEQSKRFGTNHFYAADTFIEMTPPKGDLEYLQRLGRAIYQGMSDSDPKAVWVLQGWVFSCGKEFWTQPRIKAFLDAVPNEQMLVLDLFCEADPQWSKTQAFYGKPWLWCNVHIFGDVVNVGGETLKVNNTGLNNARKSLKSGQLTGLGYVNEGLGYSPVDYDLMYEMAWRDQAVDLDQWIKNYSHYRYGKLNADAVKGLPLASSYQNNSIIERMPSLNPSDANLSKNLSSAMKAWQHMLQASNELGQVDTFRFDLVNVTRAMLSKYAVILHREVIKAHESGDVKVFRKAAENFLQLMLDMDKLLATRKEFMLGCWLEDAKRWGATDAEQKNFEWNARRVLTLWGQTKWINDYARKQWSGLISGYYYKRWELFFDEIEQSMSTGNKFNDQLFHKKLVEWMKQWSDNQHEVYPTKPKGDSVNLAQKLWKKYNDSFKDAYKPDTENLTTGKPVTCSSFLPPYKPGFANDGYFRETNDFWATDTEKYPGDPWWQVDMTKPTTVGRVVVVCYYHGNRYYGFTVETSLDGQNWKMVADRHDNKQPSTAKGYTCKFEPRKARYIRVTQTNNSANTGRHIVEVMAYEK